ncbi:hypothetical protein [Pseudomonas huanghezhanensis]|uniref:hypothetical protein n=1 Tax=Pseudomonas huanghezhanensis TaxID=3002903 RepID=UPI0022869CB7|nr:hypothetical protein [Pseudomonas sp. BSw22131]
MLIAILHTLGAVVATMAFGVIVLFISSWENERSKKVVQHKLAITLGVAVDDLADKRLFSRIIASTSERFSNDRISNRLSDLCGTVQTAWGWFGWLLQIATFIAVVWFTFAESLSNAIYAWWIIAIGVFFFVTSVLFALACRLLTGRYPGQTKKVRKTMAEVLSAQRKQMTSP